MTHGTPRTVLVTGAAGFIGSHLCEALLDEGHEVRGLDGFVDSYDRSWKEANLRALRDRRRFSFVERDLRTDRLDDVVAGVDVVINEAAFAGLPRSWTEVDTYVACNVLALERLVTASLAAGVARFVQASTSSVYGARAVGAEDQPTVPISPYGISKLAAEHLLLAHVTAHGLPATIVRYFSIYGPRQRPDMAYHRFIEALRAGRPITVFGDGLQSRSNTYVGDAVAGTIGAMEHGEVGAVYNIGGGELLTLNEAIAIIAETLGVAPRIRRAAPRAGDQRTTWADTGLARRTFGYAPTVGPAEGLARQIEWHRRLPPPVEGATLELTDERLAAAAPGGSA